MDDDTLGTSGLKVSRLALGTMTFGDDWGWGADDETSAEIFDTYVEAGGNLFDTADLYTNGRSEEMLGRFIRDRGRGHPRGLSPCPPAGRPASLYHHQESP